MAQAGWGTGSFAPGCCTRGDKGAGGGAQLRQAGEGLCKHLLQMRRQILNSRGTGPGPWPPFLTPFHTQRFHHHHLTLCLPDFHPSSRTVFTPSVFIISTTPSASHTSLPHADVCSHLFHTQRLHHQQHALQRRVDNLRRRVLRKGVVEEGGAKQAVAVAGPRTSRTSRSLQAGRLADPTNLCRGGRGAMERRCKSILL